MFKIRVLLFKEFKIFIKKQKFPLDLHLSKYIYNKNQDNILHTTVLHWADERSVHSLTNQITQFSIGWCHGSGS
jgi:hypothetical protein